MALIDCIYLQLVIQLSLLTILLLSMKMILLNLLDSYIFLLKLAKDQI